MNFKLITLVFALGAMAAFGQQPAVYSDTEAANHVDEEATVTGKVFGVSTSKTGTTYVNLGGIFPQHTFAGVIFASKQADVGDVKQYEGKDVSLTGRITLSRDASKKPQILISKADQIKLAVPASAPASMPPAPVAATSAPATAPTSAPATPMPALTPPVPKEVPISASTVQIQLASSWSSPRSGGDMTRKDLARIFGTIGTPSDTTTASAALEVYPGIPFLTQVETVKKLLKLETLQCAKSRITTAGLPFDSLTDHDFSGVFPGGYDQLHLITDKNDQVVSILLVDSSSRARVTNEVDGTGYHTYNFITGGSKAVSYYAIRHQVTPPSTPTAAVVVDTLLVDPTDPETPKPKTSKKSSSKSSYSKPKTGKILERSRWFVPLPIVNLILRSTGG